MAASPVPILFMTNAEFGQANVVLAVAQELAFNSSFQDARIANPMQFHGVAVPSMTELIKRHRVVMPHAPGLRKAYKSFFQLNHSILGWEAKEYMCAYYRFLQIIQDVRPASLVIDPGLWMAHDAARSLGMNYIVLTPSSAKELSTRTFPYGSAFWKYPVAGSGYSYPMSFLGSIKSVCLAVCAIASILITGYISRFNKARKEAKIAHKFPLLEIGRKDDLILTPYMPEIDFPYPAIPTNMRACGPIVLPPVSLDETDGQLAHWLERAPTVLVNLGTHFTSDPKFAAEQARGIKILLDSRTDLQVLWKVKYQWSHDAEVVALVEALVVSDRLRIVSWLHSEPASILETGRVVCSVHHGGANSYFEACRAGIPQVILPVWWDTYEYAARAEWLGIGLIGNRGAAPGVQGSQFGEILQRAMQDQNIYEKARELGEVCRRREGRVVAAEWVARWAAGTLES